MLGVFSVLFLFALPAYAAPKGAEMAFPRGPFRRDTNSTCHCFPGDKCWPTARDWDAFNQTLGGKLIATIPIASVCHVDPFEPYSPEKCTELQSIWGFPSTHYESSSSIMAPFFANRSCDPFLPKPARCVLGTYVQYAVNASDASDYQKTIHFTRENNVRLVIRNTAHDYYGKSSGAGALAIWTHNMKGIEVIDYDSTPSTGATQFATSPYTGKAIKMAAGVQAHEVIEEIKNRGLMVVTGFCPTVGLAGGYSQGGGHGPLASAFGLGSDQVLEWEVVTGTGEYLIASPTNNSDLYWALSGGGGGTYGVVLSMTSKAYSDRHVAAANLTFSNDARNPEKFYEAIKTFIGIQPAFVDAGGVSNWIQSNTSFSLSPAIGPGMTKSQLQAFLQPSISYLDEKNISYIYAIEEFATLSDAYNSMVPSTNTSNLQIGGRLIPRSLAESNLTALVDALRNITEAGALVSGVALNVSERTNIPANSANPAWRGALIDIVIGTIWSNTDWDHNIRNQDLMTNEYLPQLERLTPGGGAYLNEGNFQQPDFQHVFYGHKYEKLREIKNKYDPDSIFYGLTSVGSDEWIVEEDGRLCKVAH